GVENETFRASDGTTISAAIPQALLGLYGLSFREGEALSEPSGAAVDTEARPPGIESAMVSVLASLQDCRHSLPLSDAQGRQAELGVLVAHPVQQRGRDAGAAGAQRMADGDRPAARIHPLLVDAQQLEHAQDLDGERLVDLDALDLIEGQAG